mgnify:CR=1 FL=1
MNIKQKIAEAEAYQKHGLYSEALGLFEELLKNESGLNAAVQNKIEKNILSIRSELESIDKDDTAITSEDASLLRETWDDGSENINEVISSANAFKELGLYKEAAVEYAKLFSHEDFSKDILPDLADCMLQAYPPSRVLDETEKMISDHELDDKATAAVKFAFGLQMDAICVQIGDVAKARHLAVFHSQMKPVHDFAHWNDLDRFIVGISCRDPFSHVLKGGPALPIVL